MTPAQAAIDRIKNPATAEQPAVQPVSIRITPSRNGAAANGGAVEILIEAFAETGKTRKAAPLNIAFVVDRSGSMSGAPLEQAKRAVDRMIRRLKPTDRAALVVYDNAVQVPIKSAPVAEILPVLDARLRTIQSGGMTALHAGWLAGAEEAAVAVSKETLSRVILLSDGNANEGLTDTPEIARQCAMMADASVSTSTYGLGNQFNEALMTEMAAKGNGGTYYAESADDLVAKFEVEFDALAATVGRDPALTVTPAGQCLNDYRPHPSGGALIPNLVAGAASWALYRIDLPTKPVGQSHAVSVSIAYADGDGHSQTATAAIEIPVVADVEALMEDGKVADRARELEAARIQADAKNAADQGDWVKVDGAIASLRQIADGNSSILGVTDTLAGLAEVRQSSIFAKEALFASHAMSRGYTGLEEQSLEIGSMSAPRFARRQARQGKSE